MGPVVTQTSNETITESERAVWAALASDLRFGARHFAALRVLGEPLEQIWQQSASEMLAVGIDPKVIEIFAEIRATVEPAEVLGRLHEAKIRFLTILDDEYPSNLKEIAVPPAVLYVRGTIDDSPRLSVVGTRRVTDYGRRVTQELVCVLAAKGLTIVSGLALGIDGVAHQAALDAGGTTWGILGCGVDRPYPVSHERLADQMILAGGALISEFPPGTDALRHHFPIRNRIIAGLASATLVIEAAEQSGSLITARCALESNRDVFTVPGSIYAPGSAGPHRLIQLGAKLVHTVEDILLELGLEGADEEQAARQILPASAEERVILDVLTAEPMLFDALIGAVELDSATVMSTLTLMEMKGKVKNVGGNQYVRR